MWAWCMQGLKELGSLVSGGPQSDPEAAARVPAALELAAQLHYRLGHSRECIQLYDSLFQQHKVSSASCHVSGTYLHCSPVVSDSQHLASSWLAQADSLQLRTNVLAAYVSAGLSREIPDLMSAMKLSTRDSFEVSQQGLRLSA
jgi:signal recognition particle subunit SRP72